MENNSGGGGRKGTDDVLISTVTCPIYAELTWEKSLLRFGYRQEQQKALE
jgi:hypothetical protein